MSVLPAKNVMKDTSSGSRPLAAALAAFGLALGLAMATPGAALAHAIIQSATPAANATVAGPDVDVALRYNSRLDQQRSRLSVTLPDGTLRPLPVIQTPADPAVLTARLQGLTAGAYVLHWQVLAIDGHMTRGNVPFTVGER